MVDEYPLVSCEKCDNKHTLFTSTTANDPFNIITLTTSTIPSITANNTFTASVCNCNCHDEKPGAGIS